MVNKGNEFKTKLKKGKAQRKIRRADENMDFVVIAIVAVLVGLALAYIIKAKKKGVKCIGCPSSGKCSSCNHCGDDGPSCSCH